jgi:ribosomal protein L40E
LNSRKEALKEGGQILSQLDGCISSLPPESVDAVTGTYLWTHLAHTFARRSNMAYCPKCGFQNPEDSAFCSKCGGPLKAPMVGSEKDWDKHCENECAGGPRGSSIFWGIFVVLIGLGVLVWALGESNIDVPQWVTDLNIGFLFGVLIAGALIVTGISIVLKKRRT